MGLGRRRRRRRSGTPRLPVALLVVLVVVVVVAAGRGALALNLPGTISRAKSATTSGSTTSRTSTASAVLGAVLFFTAAFEPFSTAGICRADEIGVLPGSAMKFEKLEPDRLCLKRGLMGKCDVFASTAVSAPSSTPAAARSAAAPEEPESDLIRQLKKKTAENRLRNESEVQRKMFEASQAGEFGPFSRFTLARRPDNGKYELVQVRDVSRLKSQGVLLEDDRGALSFAPGKEPPAAAAAPSDEQEE
jgi:hypothetical protein